MKPTPGASQRVAVAQGAPRHLQPQGWLHGRHLPPRRARAPAGVPGQVRLPHKPPPHSDGRLQSLLGLGAQRPPITARKITQHTPDRSDGAKRLRRCRLPAVAARGRSGPSMTNLWETKLREKIYDSARDDHQPRPKRSRSCHVVVSAGQWPRHTRPTEGARLRPTSDVDHTAQNATVRAGLKVATIKSLAPPAFRRTPRSADPARSAGTARSYASGRRLALWRQSPPCRRRQALSSKSDSPPDTVPIAS